MYNKPKIGGPKQNKTTETKNRFTAKTMACVQTQIESYQKVYLVFK